MQLQSLCKSARPTSKTWALSPSGTILVPWVVPSVFPIFLIGWFLHIHKIFLRKWINQFLLGSQFTTFCKVLILAHHCGSESQKGLMSFYGNNSSFEFFPCKLLQQTFVLCGCSASRLHKFGELPNLWALVTKPVSPHRTWKCQTHVPRLLCSLGESTWCRCGQSLTSQKPVMQRNSERRIHSSG